MTSSLVISVGLLVLAKNGVAFNPHLTLPITVLFTTICWVATAYVAPATDRKTLVEFYRKVRPAGPGWTSVRREAALSLAEEARTGLNVPKALLGWSAGCAMIWSSLFTIGNFLYGRMMPALLTGVVFVVCAFVVADALKSSWTEPA